MFPTQIFDHDASIRSLQDRDNLGFTVSLRVPVSLPGNGAGTLSSAPSTLWRSVQVNPSHRKKNALWPRIDQRAEETGEELFRMLDCPCFSHSPQPHGDTEGVITPDQGSPWVYASPLDPCPFSRQATAFRLPVGRGRLAHFMFPTQIFDHDASIRSLQDRDNLGFTVSLRVPVSLPGNGAGTLSSAPSTLWRSVQVNPSHRKKNALWPRIDQRAEETGEELFRMLDCPCFSHSPQPQPS